MNIIKQKTRINNNDLERISKIVKSFRSAKRGNRARFLSALAREINKTENRAVRNWLVKFTSILKSWEVSK